MKRCHWLPIGKNRHTTVLGYPANGEGRTLFDELNWNEWWPDDMGDGTYLHVECKTDEKSYRVRCQYEVWGTYLGRMVRSVNVGMKGGKLHWIVRTI